MTRTLTALAAAGAIAAAAITAPTTAEARNGRIAAGVIGGIAAGAIIGSALAAPYYYGGGPYYGAGYYGGGPYSYGAYYTGGPYDYGYDGGGPYYAYVPVYGDYGPGCYWQRERFWDGWGWRLRRVQVCP